MRTTIRNQKEKRSSFQCFIALAIVACLFSTQGLFASDPKSPETRNDTLLIYSKAFVSEFDFLAETALELESWMSEPFLSNSGSDLEYEADLKLEAWMYTSFTIEEGFYAGQIDEADCESPEKGLLVHCPYQNRSCMYFSVRK